jgi:predicted RNA methylase
MQTAHDATCVVDLGAGSGEYSIFCLKIRAEPLITVEAWNECSRRIEVLEQNLKLRRILFRKMLWTWRSISEVY